MGSDNRPTLILITEKKFSSRTITARHRCPSYHNILYIIISDTPITFNTYKVSPAYRNLSHFIRLSRGACICTHSIIIYIYTK